MSSKKIGFILKFSNILKVVSFFIFAFSCGYFFQISSPDFQNQSNTFATRTPDESLSVCFTPNESCLPKIIKEISQASSSISLLGYSFTSKPIARALIEAKHRGISIKIVLDHSQKTQKPSLLVIQELVTAGIPVRFDHSVKIAHNKVMIIDNSKVITGSYNWSHSAEFKNAENLLFIKSESLLQRYIDFFESRWLIAKTK